MIARFLDWLIEVSKTVLTFIIITAILAVGFFAVAGTNPFGR